MAGARIGKLSSIPVISFVLAVVNASVGAAVIFASAGASAPLPAVLTAHVGKVAKRPISGPPSTNAKIPPDCGKMKLLPGSSPANVGCAYADGYADAAKLGSAVALLPVFVNLDVLTPKPCPNQTTGGTIVFCAVANAQLTKPFHATGTFLAFGFVPITATLTLAAVQPIHVQVRQDGYLPNPTGKLTDFKLVALGFFTATVSHVLVNGVPLAVGPSCGTGQPFKLTLRGTSPQYTSVFLGGPLYGEASLTPFTHCGVGENLDPLLTASVSGPKNFTKVTQGEICVPRTPGKTCPPAVPVLRR